MVNIHYYKKLILRRGFNYGASKNDVVLDVVAF